MLISLSPSLPLSAFYWRAAARVLLLSSLSLFTGSHLLLPPEGGEVCPCGF